MLHSAAATAAAAAIERPGMPKVGFGRHQISRLIVGGNPVSGNSHWSGALDREMLDYFSAANIKKLLRDCEQAGVDTWQSRGDKFIIRMLREYRNEGGKIAWIAQTASELSDIDRNIRDIAAAGAIGAYHHGSATDKMWASGNIDLVRDRLKVMRDCGMRAGLGTHIPEVIDYAESKGWEADFYMTCLYNLSRPKEEAAKLAGGQLNREYFHEPDRDRMLERVRRTSKQCLIFKVYGASRLCASEDDMRKSLRQVFQYAKSTDAVVIGMFPKRTEQVTQNCRLLVDAVASS